MIFEVYQQSEELHYGLHRYFDFDTFVNKTLASFWSASLGVTSSAVFGGLPLSDYLIWQQQTSRLCLNSFEVLDNYKGQFKMRILALFQLTFRVVLPEVRSTWKIVVLS